MTHYLNPSNVPENIRIAVIIIIIIIMQDRASAMLVLQIVGN
jgi:hypothetical protein